jgi:GT2 family glycosyltransferase
MTGPYISIVIIGRNDNYGVDFVGRISNFVQHLDRQVKSHPDLVELIVVEWNPLVDREDLSLVLPKTQNLSVRVITVGNDLHHSIGNKVPVYENYAKNVGARRAKGNFVLFTNPDILFTDELITEFSRRRLRPTDYYRVDRYDFESAGMNDLPPEYWIDHAVNNTFQAHITADINSVSPTFDPVSSIWYLPRSIITNRSLHTNASGDFILISRSALDKVGGLFEDPEEIYHNDSYSVIRLHYHGLIGIIFSTPLCIFHQHHDRNEREAWNPEKAYKLGRTTGLESWGLRDHELPEWNNK